MAGKFVLALDQGTTSSRAIVFDHGGQVAGKAQQEITQHFPAAGLVEHDAGEIWQTQLDCGRKALIAAGATAADVAAIGIANQRETTVVWNRATGEPIHPAIVWQDRRTADFCDDLDRRLGDLVRERTGLVVDAYFSASKVRWLLDHVDGARRDAEAGRLLFGTVDTWLLWNLTGGPDGGVHATDVTNASRTMLMDLATQTWDERLCDELGIPPAMLPEIRSSGDDFGTTSHFGGSIPISGIAGDQQAALFGQTCFDRGLAKRTYGTGCFMLMHVGDEPVASTQGLLSTPAWRRDDQAEFALEGSVFVGGAVVKWLRDGLGIIDSVEEIEALAETVDDTNDVYLVPAFAGLGAPHWDQYARGTIVGLTGGTTRAHLARAALEGIAFQVADVLDVMRADSQLPIDELRVDGGAAANDLLMQFQADVYGVPCVRPQTVETTALGAAYLAGLQVGFWVGLDEVRSIWRVDKRFEPAMSMDERERRRNRWSQALSRATEWDRA
ncbi:MAG: glycerol kinase GlpK [Planctomycetota bacterium]